MRTQNQKLKLLLLMDILLNETDEAHPMTADRMIKKLEARGISAERKAVYRDVDALAEYGLDIIKVKNKGVFVGSRQFDLAELKLLADAVASSKFMTAKKSESLIRKIQMLASRYQAKSLNRGIYYLDRAKSDNEQIYYSIDTIHQAVLLHRQISFIYYEYGPDKNLRPKRNGSRYRVSPMLLLWDDRNYYLIAYYPRYQGLSHFRVDKMGAIEILDADSESHAPDLNPAAYATQTFSMFGGELKRVEISFRPELIGVFIDRFGKDMMVTKAGDWLKTTVNVNVSVTFYGWVFQLGRRAKINAPEQVVKGFTDYLDEVNAQYR